MRFCLTEGVGMLFSFEKAETELTEIEVYSVLRNGFGQCNTESY